MRKLLPLLVVFAAHPVQADENPSQDLIVKLTLGASASKIALKYGLNILDYGYRAPFVLFETRTGENLSTIMQQMATDPTIQWVEDDDNCGTAEVQQKGSTIGAVGDRNALYAQNKRLLTQVHFSSTVAALPGRLLKVAVLDTGLSPHQPALWSKTVWSINMVEPHSKAWDIPHHTDSNGDGIPDEGTGHGTMVAGIIDQISPQSKLIVIRIADSDGTTTAWRIIKGLTYAAGQGAEVANISLGSRREIPALGDVLDWTEQQGLLVVAPVGNDAQSQSEYPAKLDQVLSVAGLEPTDVKAQFSNWDPGTVACAPATGVKSYWWDGTMGVWSGTSFSSPILAATVAEGLRQSGKRAPELLRSLARSTGVNIDKYNPTFAGNLGTLVFFTRLVDKIVSSSGGGGGS